MTWRLPPVGENDENDPRGRLRVIPHSACAIFGLSCWPIQEEQSIDMKSGTQDKIEGHCQNLAGKVEEGAGMVLGNPDWKPKAIAIRSKATSQKKVGEIKKVFDK